MRVGHAAWAFATPALLVIGVFFFVPVLPALIVSLTDFDLYALADIRNLRFVGLSNYRHLLHTPDFWRAVVNTGYFVAVGVPLSLAASLASALLVNSRLAYFTAFFRTVFFAPVVTTLVGVGVAGGRGPVAGVPPHHAADVASDPAAGEHPDGGRIFPAVRGAVCDDSGRAAAEHRQRAVLHVRRRLQVVESGFRIRGRVPAVPHDPRSHGAATAPRARR